MPVISAAQCSAIVSGTYICVTDAHDALVCLIEAGNVTDCRLAVRRMFKRGWCHKREDGAYRLQLYAKGFPLPGVYGADKLGLRQILVHYKADASLMEMLWPDTPSAQVIELSAWRSRAVAKVQNG